MNRIEAARRNGAMSNGPATAEGKAISAKNALTFGLTANDVLITGENAAEYDALMDAACHEFSPANAREFDLVGEIVANRWRMRRVIQMEQAVITAEIRKIQDDKDAPGADFETAKAMAWANLPESSAMKQIHRHETRLRRHTEKAVAELKELARTRSQEIAAPEKPAQIRPSAPVQNEPEPACAVNQPETTPVAAKPIALPFRTSQEFTPTWSGPSSSFVRPKPQNEPDVTRKYRRAA